MQTTFHSEHTMISNIYIDLETVPGDTFMLQEVAEKVSPPASYSKPDTIAAWMAEKAPAAIESARHALGLHPAYCKIISLAWAFEGEEVQVYSGTEAAILKCFYEDLATRLLQTKNGYSFRVIGHNIVDFDLPVLFWACLRNKIPYAPLPHPRRIKAWETEKVVDTMYALGGREKKGYSLGAMCKLFGINDPNPEVDGSMVWDIFRAGRIREIEDYNVADVEMVRELYRRIREWI